MTLYYRTPELPWNDSADKRRFGVILVFTAGSGAGAWFDYSAHQPATTRPG